jgi:hypothetical protein
MSFDIINTTLAAAVADNGTFTVAFPTGRSAGSYAGSHAHKLYVNQTLFEAPVDFTLAFTTVITVTWKADTTLPAGTEVALQVDIAGSDDRASDDVLPAGVKQAALHLIDLGSPIALDADGIFDGVTADDSVNVYTSADFKTGFDGTFAVPRALTLVGSASADQVVTVTGTDRNGDVLVESLTADGATPVAGKKAFATVTSASVAIGTAGQTVDLGWGDVLGLPVFLPSTSHIYGELVDGVNVQAPPVVYLQGRMLAAAVDAGTSYWILSPVAGTITRLSTIVESSTTTGGGITVEVNTTAVNGLSVTVANSAAAGDYDTDTPTAGHASTAVAVGDSIEIIPAAAFNGAGDISFVLEIQPATSGTAVAGVTTVASATTGDVRGTYDPASACDGALAFQLLVSLPDPTDQGVPQYAG